MISKSVTMLDAIKVPENPFPGLRPFEFHESDLFFGRDGQVEKLIEKLSATRFLAVVGTSGSGKSSLVRAGLLPALMGGMMKRAGSNWRFLVMRPGNDPIGNLARTLNEPEIFGSDEPENVAIQTAVAETTLRRGTLGLIEVARQNAMPKTENLLVVVDQFEELFRFAREAARKTKEESDHYQNDAAAFVKLLLQAKAQEDVNIFVVLTMRSDFLGDCAQFWDLPEAINESQYLIPRLTRDQLREVITGPVALGLGEISPRLVTQLLNDIGDNQDQLPVLQHLLMRVWDECKQKRLDVEVEEASGRVIRRHQEVHDGTAIDLCCYEAVGGIAEALSYHADEAFNELPDGRSREVAEKLFKCLTEKGEDNREIRRPITLGEICAVTGATATTVTAVIDVFSQPSRSFLMSPANVDLKPESLIDISHESLIRGWERLKGWVDEEARSARTYRRLAETAVLHKTRGAGLWRDPDLQIALTWREKDQPNEAWARRYHPEFKTAIDFLNKSRRRKRLRLTFYSVLFVLGIFMVSGMAWFRQQGVIAEARGKADLVRQQEESRRQRELAAEQLKSEQALQAAEAARQRDLERLKFERQQQVAQLESTQALQQARFAEERRQLAEQQSDEAKRLQQIAESKTKEANDNLALANQREREVKVQLEKTNQALAEVRRQQTLKEQAEAKATTAQETAQRASEDAKLANNKATAAEQETTEVGNKLQDTVLAALRPEGAAAAVKLIERAKQKGIDIRLIAGYRSIEQQQALYDRGRTKPGPIVTNTKFSAHNTGLAFDVAIIRNGALVWSGPDYDVLGALGEEIGLVWGGRWKFPDKPHFETRDAQDTLKKLLSLETRKS